MPFFIPESNPRLLDNQFAARYTGLDMRTTINSGAKHGDGDLAPRARQYNGVSFAAETKARFRGGPQTMRTAEYVKAKAQLRKLDPQAVRLFVVYSSVSRTITVAFAEEDLALLPDNLADLARTLAKKIENPAGTFLLLTEPQFDAFHAELIST